MSRSIHSLRFEQLEEKKMLAGDVAVSVVNGALHIEGDDLGNQIVVSSGEAPGEYLIRGLNDTVVQLTDAPDPDDPPPVEGEAPENAVIVTGVRRGIHVAMNDGDDSVVLHDARVRGDVIINTGSGADHVRVGLPPAPLPGLVSAEVEEESNGLPAGVSIGRSLVIRTSDGDDTVLLGGRPAAETEDGIEEAETTENGTRRGATLRIGQNLTVRLGDGEDELTAGAVQINRSLSARGGDGPDSVSLNHVRAAMASIGTGDGDDEVDVLDSVFGMLGVRTRDGNDTVSITGTRARLAILLGGGGEQDTWNDLGENSFGRLVTRGFELPQPVVEDSSEAEPV